MPSSAGSFSVNLSAVSENWQLLQSHLADGCVCGAVVKADAYGLGVAPVSQALYSAGCTVYFVAHLDEGVALRRVLPAQAVIYVLQGVVSGGESEFKAHGLRPVLISKSMFERWRAFVDAHADAPQCAVKVNSGMNRLGMTVSEFEQLSILESAKSMRISLVLSHLACADTPEHELNIEQLARFQAVVDKAQKLFPKVSASLANSAAIMLGESYHFSVARPGLALYGGQPSLHESLPLSSVVSISAPVIQVRELPVGEAVGYGADYVARSDRVVVVVSVGYADGFFRAMAGRGAGGWFGQFVPLLGRVSMDSMVFDITDIPLGQRPQEGDSIELLGPNISLRQLAEWAQTSEYEVLTHLGGRLQRQYLEHVSDGVSE